jgi:hypothetical protein
LVYVAFLVCCTKNNLAILTETTLETIFWFFFRNADGNVLFICGWEKVKHLLSILDPKSFITLQVDFCYNVIIYTYICVYVGEVTVGLFKLMNKKYTYIHTYMHAYQTRQCKQG